MFPAKAGTQGSQRALLLLDPRFRGETILGDDGKQAGGTLVNLRFRQWFRAQEEIEIAAEMGLLDVAGEEAAIAAGRQRLWLPA